MTEVPFPGPVQAVSKSMKRRDPETINVLNKCGEPCRPPC
jgi:hypothetical protein